MAADQPEQQPPPISQPRYASSPTAGPIDPAGSTSSPDSAGRLDSACTARSSGSSGRAGSSRGHAPGEEPPDGQDRVAALVAEARAQGPLPGPRPDPQRSHRPPLLPHLPDVEREEVDAIIGRVLAESTGS
jgi:hypothetical protein